VVRVLDYRSRGSGFDSGLYHIFGEVVGLKLGPLSLVRIIEELLGRNSSSPGLENRDFQPTQHPLSIKVCASFTGCGGQSVGIVHLLAV
jgi:hypothetical protein